MPYCPIDNRFLLDPKVEGIYRLENECKQEREVFAYAIGICLKIYVTWHCGNLNYVDGRRSRSLTACESACIFYTFRILCTIYTHLINLCLSFSNRKKIIFYVTTTMI